MTTSRRRPWHRLGLCRFNQPTHRGVNAGHGGAKSGEVSVEEGGGDWVTHWRCVLKFFFFFTHFFLRGYFSGENNTFSLDKDPRQLRRCWILDFYKFLDSSNRRCDWDSWARAIFSCPGVVHGRCRGQRGHECRWVEVDIHSRVLHRRTPGPFAKCRQNCLMAINFLVSLLKKNWNNVKWGCPGNEASLWVSNILGFFCFFFLFTFIELWWVDSDTQCGERTLEASCTSIYPKALAHQKHHGVCCLSRVDDNASCTSTYISDINLAVSWLFCFMIFEKIHSF